jgi:hypothetical protein
MKSEITLMFVMLTMFGVACESKAMKQIKQETAALLAQAKQQNTELLKVNQGIVNCKIDLAKARKERPIYRADEVSFEIPPAPEVTVPALEIYKQTLTGIVENQKIKIAELTGNYETCVKQLAAVRKKPLVKKKPATKRVRTRR